MEPTTGTEEHSRGGIEFSCCRCLKVVRICQSCWRNQKYCSEQCSHEATLERHRKNQNPHLKIQKIEITGVR